MEKLILTTALTGAITVPTQTPHLKYTIEGIADDAIACAKAGSTSVHIHARDPENGRPSSDPEIVRKIVTRIKEGCDVIICITTGGGMGMTPQERLRGAALCKPELASFNLGSMNFSMHPVARRYKPEDWKFDWEQAYVDVPLVFTGIHRVKLLGCQKFALHGQAPFLPPLLLNYDWIGCNNFSIFTFLF